jgi:hypothetical protein
MKKALLTLVITLIATAGAAQNVTIGGRYSNYSTEISSSIIGTDAFSLETGRESSLGFIGEFRSGMLVLGAQFDHDFEGGVGIGFFDFAEFSRDRFEAVVGIAPAQYVDVFGGFRFESLTLGGSSFFGDRLFEEADIDHQALVLGTRIHTPTIRPVGFYGEARGYFGTAESSVARSFNLSSDTTGFKVEAGIQIPVGTSGWEIVPGIEWERIEAQDFELDFETNRFFVKFLYSFGA